MQLISVIMPAYNAEKFIRQAIDSILNQTYPHLELLIADDASKDHTKKIIESYTDSRIKCFHNEVNLGYLKTCNKLMALAQGNFLAFQDADDISDVHRFEEQLKAFDENTQLGAVGCNMTAIDTQGQYKFTTTYALSHKDIFNLIPDDFSMIPNSFMFTREVYEKIGGYHEFWDRRGAEDYYWAFLIMEQFELINLKKPLYYYRYNPQSITGDLSNNIDKIFTRPILNFILNQRKQKGFDSLENDDDNELKNYRVQIEKPYKDDPSLFYREIAAKYFYEGLKKRCYKLLFKALLKNPFKRQTYKDFAYFLRYK